MATTGDIRDIMDLGHDGFRQPAPKKKKKLLDTQPRLSGMSREVQALMGDSVPPVAIVEAPKYKQRPSVTMKLFKPRHWEEKGFVHGARKDGLQLKHWKRSIPGSNIRTPAVDIVKDVEMTDGDNEMPAITELRFEDEFPSEKWNVEVPVKRYDDEQYEKYFKSEEWTRAETDYLMELCQDYDLRWLLIADRYDPDDIGSQQNDDTSVKPTYPQRKMEELKQRYYTTAAKMLELQTPASNMTQSEFQLWEKMRNFDARTEVQRKAMAEKLFERTKEEADEEKVLLEELYRITKNEDDFIKMRKELYARLETAPSLRRNERGEEPSTALYQTSQGLNMLLTTLVQKERRLKTRVVPNGQEPASASQTPADTQKARHGPQHHRRETMDSNAAEDNPPPNKKGSSVQAPVVRTLTPAEEVKFGVTHPQERTTSGIMFRHEKINRLTMAKSQVQTQKIGAALTELGIPPRLLMPTERVCREFERLVGEVQILLDTRRVLEKVSSEVKVLEEHKKLRLNGGQNPDDGENQETGADAMELDNSTMLADQQDSAGADATARDGIGASVSTQNGNKAEGHKLQRYDTGVTEDDSVMGNQDKEDEDDKDDGSQEDDDDEEDNEDQDRQDEDEDEDDADNDVEQSFAQNEEEDEDDEADRYGEDEDDEDDGPGLADLERANQLTDDEDEENEDENEGGQSQFDDEEDEGQDEDDEAEDDDQAEVDESTLNGAREEDEEEEDEEEESRPVSAHSNTRAHKRSASVLSNASRADSTRSGGGRKKRR